MIYEFFYQENYSILIVFVCLILSSFFSAAETAITSLGTLKVKHLLDSKGKSVKQLSLWVTHPGRVITTILIFNNVVNILASSVTTYVTNKYFDSAAISIATGVTTFLVLVFGEIIPKSFAKSHSEGVAVFSMRIIMVIYFISYPLVLLLSGFADIVIKFFSSGKKKSPLITEEEIEFIVSEGEKAGVIKDLKKDIIEGAFDFDETRVKEIMSPRTNLTAFSVSTSLVEAINEARKTGFSRIPVYKDSLDHIIGILMVKDLLDYTNDENKNLTVKDIMREAFFAPESKSIMGVFKDLKRSKNHMAIIIDEYGGTAGIVTMEDILEEIVGEIQDEFDAEEAKILEVEDNIFEVSGSLNIDEFIDYFDIEIDQIDDEIKPQDADTMAGWITQLVRQMPKNGQNVEILNFSFEVVDVKNRRIEMLRVKKNKDFSVKVPSTSLENDL